MLVVRARLFILFLLFFFFVFLLLFVFLVIGWHIAARDAAAVALCDPKDRLNRTQDEQEARIALVGRVRLKLVPFDIGVTSFVDRTEVASWGEPYGQGGREG